MLYDQESYVDSLHVKADTMFVEKIENQAFKIGELLKFDIVWRKSFIGITAGHANMLVKDTVRIKNRLCYHVEVTARSTSFIENFFEVNDTISTYIDVEYGMSWKFVKKTREGSYYKDIFIDYDHLYNKAYVEEYRYHDKEGKKIKKQEKYWTEIKPFTQDILSSFYYMRMLYIESGYPMKIPNNSKKKNYMLNVYVNPEETQEVDAGEFKTLMLSPVIEGESIFNQEGAMKVWVTNDKFHMPVRMKSAVALGSINVELASYKRPE